MKLFQLNLFGILVLLAVLLVAVVLPSFIIQTIWNTAYASHIEADLSIEVWQAGLLWGAIVTLLYMTGIFRFQLSFKSLENIDVESIDDPELRNELEELKLKTQKAEQQTKRHHRPEDKE